MGNGIQFTGDGPVMSGTWYNPQTGHKFTVRDCFFQDGQFMVQTTDGRMLDYNMIQNYVQATDSEGREVQDRPMMESMKSTNPVNDIPQEVADMLDTDTYMLPEDEVMISGPQSSVSTQETPVHTSGFHQVVEDPDMPMVERVLRRFNDINPTISIDYNKLPKKQLDTLVDVLGIAPQTIAEYYIKKLDVSKVFEELKASIVEAVERCLYAEVYETQKIQEDIENAREEDQKLVDSVINIIPEGTDCVLRQDSKSLINIKATYPPEPVKTKKKSSGKKTTKKNASK